MSSDREKVKVKFDSNFHADHASSVIPHRPPFNELSNEVDHMRSDHATQQKLRGAFNVLCRTTSVSVGPEVQGGGGLRSVHRVDGP